MAGSNLTLPPFLWLGLFLGEPLDSHHFTPGNDNYYYSILIIMGGTSRCSFQSNLVLRDISIERQLPPAQLKISQLTTHSTYSCYWASLTLDPGKIWSTILYQSITSSTSSQNLHDSENAATQ